MEGGWRGFLGQVLPQQGVLQSTYYKVYVTPYNSCTQTLDFARFCHYIDSDQSHPHISKSPLRSKSPPLTGIWDSAHLEYYAHLLCNTMPVRSTVSTGVIFPHREMFPDRATTDAYSGNCFLVETAKIININLGEKLSKRGNFKRFHRTPRQKTH